MNLITKNFAEELAEKEMRDAFLAAQTRTRLASQIRTIRTQRGWSQAQLANELRTLQSAISRMEDRSYGKLSLQSLFEIAAAFDVGLMVEFVPYDEFLLRTSDLSLVALSVEPFDPLSLTYLYEGQPQASTSSIAVNNAAPRRQSMTPGRSVYEQAGSQQGLPMEALRSQCHSEPLLSALPSLFAQGPQAWS